MPARNTGSRAATPQASGLEQGSGSGSGQPPTGGGGGGYRKRKNHRAGKKKRRKSFNVIVSNDVHGEEDNMVDDPLKDAAQTANLRDDFYSMSSRNLSSGSVDSANLHDHREQMPFLRARRPSLATPTSNQPGKFSFAQQSPTTRSRSTAGAMAAVESGDDEDNATTDNEGAPLLSQSQSLLAQQQQQRSSNSRRDPGYGTVETRDSSRRSRPQSRRASSQSSGRKTSFLSPLGMTPGNGGILGDSSYNINYPPSVPGSPRTRPSDRLSHNNLSFGDEMLREEMGGGKQQQQQQQQQQRQDHSAVSGSLPRSPPRSRGGLNNTGDTGLGDGRGAKSGNYDNYGDYSDHGDYRRYGSEAGNSTEALLLQPSPMNRRRTSVLDAAEAEADVCFPQEGLSEIAEDEHEQQDSRDRSPYRARPNRRRRGKWPDLAILEEWSHFEVGHQSQARRAKKITEPQLVNGRLRPIHKGWHRAEEDAPYRFTYFNEEFQSTIHSQTISELLQPGGSFRELFIPDPPLLSDSDGEDEEGAAAAAAGFPSVVGDEDFMSMEEDGDGEEREREREREREANEPVAGLHRSSFSLPSDAQQLFPSRTHSMSRVMTSSEKKCSSGSGSGSGSNGSPARSTPSGVRSPSLRTKPRLADIASGFGLGSRAGSRTGSGTRSPATLVLSDRQDTRGTTATTIATGDRDRLKMAEMAAVKAEDATAAAATAASAAAAAVGTLTGTTSAMPPFTATLEPQPEPEPEPAPPSIRQRKERPPRYGERPVWWLDVLSPTEAEMRVLSKTFGIHPLTAEDIIMQEPREKVELFQHYYFVSYRSFDQDPNSETFLEPVNMYVVVFREGVLSFHFSMTPHPANVRRRIRQLRDYMLLSSDWVSYAIIDDITDVFVPLIQNIEDEVDDIDDAILQMHSSVGTAAAAAAAATKSGGLTGGYMRPNTSGASEKNDDPTPAQRAETDSDMLRRVGACRKRVMGLYRLLGNKADVIRGFAKRCNEHWEVAPRSEIGLYLGDIQDHIVTMTSNLSHYEKILSRSHGNYLAQINIRMNERQEQTADVLGKLTVLGTIVLPMNIITGLWGMNVWVPGQDYEGDLRWFAVITAGLIFFGLACYLIAKRVYQIV